MSQIQMLEGLHSGFFGAPVVAEDFRGFDGQLSATVSLGADPGLGFAMPVVPGGKITYIVGTLVLAGGLYYLWSKNKLPFFHRDGGGAAPYGIEGLDGYYYNGRSIYGPGRYRKSRSGSSRRRRRRGGSRSRRSRSRRGSRRSRSSRRLRSANGRFRSRRSSRRSRSRR